MKDLEDESGDEPWNATPKATKNDFSSDSARIGSGAKKTRIVPSRRAVSKDKFDEKPRK